MTTITGHWRLSLTPRLATDPYKRRRPVPRATSTVTPPASFFHSPWTNRRTIKVTPPPLLHPHHRPFLVVAPPFIATSEVHLGLLCLTEVPWRAFEHRHTILTALRWAAIVVVSSVHGGSAVRAVHDPQTKSTTYFYTKTISISRKNWDSYSKPLDLHRNSSSVLGFESEPLFSHRFAARPLDLV
jgi:hypothetical protein